ncbi:MAG: HEAT repeat domain-containing protein [Verrucomicrobia bacterium]|nr:HEAT repeat domain-containing protein [Verrucomicrobiota bacterium]
MATTKPDVGALVEQMPETDRELQSKQPPEPDKPDQPRRPRRLDSFGEASKFTGPDPKAAEKIFAEIVAGGRDSILELIGLARDPSDADFKNYKAGYVLHGVALYVGRSENDRQRRLFAETLASQLSSEKLSKAVKGFLIRELQVAGGKEVAETLGRHLQDDELCEYVVQALIAIREGAGVQLRRGLEGATGKNRVTIIQALGVVRDTESAGALQRALSASDSDVRIAAACALGNIGDSGSVVALIKAADEAKGWEGIQNTKACLVLAERLLAAGKKADANRIYTHLRDSRTEAGERYVREAAEKALSGDQ